LNPGPKILPSRIYMLSSELNPTFNAHPEQRLLNALLLYLVVRPQAFPTTSLKSRRFTPALQARAGKAAQQLTLPVRNYNRLRLYLRFRLFYELTEGSACNGKLTYPRRIRFTPSIHSGAAYAAFPGLPAVLSRHPAYREVSCREQGQALPSPYPYL
jgi:hypothetical protein